MRKTIKKFSRVTGLHHLAATIQESRRDLLRSASLYDSTFSPGPELDFRIDNASRKPFGMFTRKNADMVSEMKAFLQEAKGKKCFLDIGSHYGIYSLTFTAINPNGIAYAIEPSIKCQKVLRRNLVLNPKLNIKPVPKALGSGKEPINMHYEWVHLIADSNGSPSSTLQIETITLDQLVASEGIKPDLIKIDVDGYEGPVIDGATDYLSKNDPIIFLELHGKWVERYDYTTNQLAEKLSSFGYQFFDLELKQVTNISEAFSEFANRLICVKNIVDLGESTC